jgi:hypothetical protein
MSLLDWSCLRIEDVFSFGIWVLMMLMMISLALWLARSIMENVIKMGRRIRRPNYDAALLRENERLRDSLAEAQEENDYLRKLYRSLPPRAEEDRRTKSRMSTRAA